MFPGGKRRPVRRADNLTTFMCRLSWNLGAPISRKPQALNRDCCTFPFYIIHTTWIRTRSSNLQSVTSLTKCYGSSSLRKSVKHQWSMWLASGGTERQHKDGTKLPNKGKLTKPKTSEFGTKSHLKRCEEVNLTFQRENMRNYSYTYSCVIFVFVDDKHNLGTRCNWTVIWLFYDAFIKWPDQLT
jgi:hypothetical protein